MPFFSNAQKKILKDVRESDGWGSKIDIKNFFIQLEKSGFSVYFKEGKEGDAYIEKVSFYGGKVTQEEKIKVKLFQAEKTDFFPLVQNDFVIRIKDELEFSDIRKRILFFSEKKDNFVCYIKNKKIFIVSINTDSKEVLKRIINKNYDRILSVFSERFETKLTEKQVFSINILIKNIESFFNLETSIQPNFIIKKFEEIKKSIVVDFDAEQQILDIRAVVDYGCKKINIAETIFTKNISGNKFFSRRANNFYGFKYIFKIEGKNIFYADVDHDGEIEFFKHLLSFYKELGFTKNITLHKKGARQINHFLASNWENFKKLPYKIIYENNTLDKKLLDFKASVDVHFSGKSQDWLSFDAEFFLGDNKISLNQLKLYAAGKQNYILGTDGEIIEVKNKKELERFIAMISAFHQNKHTGKFEGELYSAIDLENIFTSSEHYTAQFNSGFKKFITEAKSNKSIEEIKISKKYTDILRKYQKEGLDWMHFLKKYHFGGILADDMGLGKTIQTLIMLELNKVKNKPSIVIVPKTLIGNWIEETKKFSKSTSFKVVDGSQKERKKIIQEANNFNLIITSYSFFQKDADIYKKEKITFNYAVLDEAQYIKNFQTRNARVVKEIDADFRLALTGTPLENSIGEIWSIFEFLMPGFLGKQADFTKKYVVPIIRDGDTEKMKDLRKKISLFMLRRAKDSVLKELPVKTIQNLSVELSKDQNLLYQEVLANIKTDVLKNVNGKNFGKSYMNILAALTRLRQICDHPNLILKDKDYKKYSSAKLDLFLNLVSKIKSEGKKVLVFSQFKTMLEILQKELDAKKVNYSYLAGETKNRKEVIDKFNKSKSISVFLISLKAGGVGINLTSADNVILFDPWWNPSVEKQAIDRAHRIGQKKKVNVYKLISKGTIEEKILKLQEKKQCLFDSLIDDTGDVFKKLSWDDIKDLFQ